MPRDDWRRYVAPAAFLLAATIAVVLIRSGLQAGTAAGDRTTTAGDARRTSTVVATTTADDDDGSLPKRGSGACRPETRSP